ncbi:MAG: dihydrolipoyl dehydrogenase [Solirubrobacterales bacterium]|nr:dihydrolipoyl dehydrogenase [Solirubrobacterales bacterium]MBV9942963.1 dihydrolipoyl dehydrogenase [Solirubrobacterales bacterium]
MPEASYDCIVVGSGPGGYVAAIRAAQLGMKTAVVEKDRVGGRCLNYACIPAKAILRVADVLSEVREADDFGIKVGEPTVEWSGVLARRGRVVKTLTGGVSGLFKKNGIELIEGEGALAGGGDITVADNTISAKTIILATGSVKRPIPGTEFGGRVIGTEEAWDLPEPPRTLAVVGAGASGAEIASAYARLGAEVTLFEALDRVLPTEDADISKVVDRGLKRQGITIHTNTFVENIESTESICRYTHGDQAGEAEWLVIATGRGPDIEALGLDKAGVKLGTAGLVEVDGAMRTSAQGIYAIGDLTRGPALAHKASDEGVIAVEDAAGRETHPIEYADVPRATFCTPNVGSFGLTEQQARDQGHDVVVGKLQYGAVGAGTVYGDRTGLVKIVGETQYGELLGGHIVGSRATELIQELVNVRALEGGYPEVARIIHGHPTLSEAVMEAGRAADGWLVHG